MRKIHTITTLALLIALVILGSRAKNIDRYIGLNFSDDMQYLNEELINVGTEILADGKYKEIPDDELIEKIEESELRINKIVKSVHSYKELNNNYDVDITSASYILSKVSKKIRSGEGLTESDRSSLNAMVELNRNTYKLIRSSYYMDDGNLLTEMKLPSFTSEYIKALDAIADSL